MKKQPVSHIIILAFAFWGIYYPTLGQNKNFTIGPETKYVAIGASLSAGVRSGGIFRESQQTAFPNLLAQQFGLKEFKQPLFDEQGTGHLKAVIQNGILNFTPATDVLLDISKEEIKLPKVDYQVNNLAVPYLKVRTLMLPSNEKSAFPPSFEKKSYSYFNRLLAVQDEGQLSYHQYIEKAVKEVDFFTFEVGTDDFISYYKAGGYGESISFLAQDREGFYPESTLISYLINKGGKGVISNVPNVLRFPFFSYYTYEDLIKKSDGKIFVERYSKYSVRLADPRDIFIPSSGVNNLAGNNQNSPRGLQFGTPLFDNEVIGYEEQVDVNEYNKKIKYISQLHNLPIVDLYTLYNAIMDGNYITHDGVKIDPGFPTGNFFSADGISPTALGQRVIANEFIKVINNFYKTSIPFLPTKY